MINNNNFEFNFSSDDWNDQSSYIWSEQNGRKYLLDVAQKAKKFYNLYIRHRHIVNHLDFIFITMQWKTPESRVQTESDELYKDVSVNTFHCNPLNIAFTSIFAFIENIFEIAIKGNCFLSVSECFNLYRLITKILLNQQQGIYSIDSGDFVLAVCHFKKVIAVVNEVLEQMSTLKLDKSTKKDKDFIKDLMTALFDIQELSWQALSFCNSVAEN